MTWTYNKSKLYKISDCWSTDMFNCDFYKKGLGLFEYEFSRKIFLMLYSIIWQNFIVWLLLHFVILGYIAYIDIGCIEIISFPVDDVIHFELTLAFLSSRFPTWLKIAKSVAKNWVRPESGSLSHILVSLKMNTRLSWNMEI